MTADATREKPLNILFITADQWRGDCLSALGHPMVKTPHLDALAADGVLFANHFANAAPCGPSRATLHTGMYLQNHRSGTNGTPLDARHTNWALEAGRIGYDPVLFGYTDTANDPRELQDDSPWLRTYEGPLPGIRPVCMMGTWPTPWTDWLSANGYEVPDDIRHAYGVRAPGPFIAHLSLLRPHPPFVAPKPYSSMYDPAEVPGFVRAGTREEEGDQHPWLAHQLSRKLYTCPDDEKKLRRMKAVYYGLMSEVDDALGRVFASLKELGLWDNTLIVFTSDHGEQMGDHWLLGKGGYFDASYRIPLIIRDPRPAADAERGKVVRSFTENVDIMPTMLDLIGAETPVQCDGASLRPFLEGPETPASWRRQAHWEFDFRDPADDTAEKKLGLTLHQCTMNIIRDDRFKYVHFTHLPPLFFDLEKDPHEMVNRANDPAYLPLVLDYAQKLLSWRMNHDEQTLTHIALTDDGPVARPAARY